MATLDSFKNTEDTVMLPTRSILLAAAFVSFPAFALPEPSLPPPQACPAVADMSRFQETIAAEKGDFLSSARATFAHIVSQARWAQRPGAETVIEQMFKPEIALEFTIKRPIEDKSTGKITYGEDIAASRIIQSTKGGPAGGGIRMADNAVVRDSMALALEQQLKNILMSEMGISAGGAKGIIAINPKSLTTREFHSVMRQYVTKLAEAGILDPKIDKPAPDVGFRSFDENGNKFNMMDLMFNELVAHTAVNGKFADPRMEAGMKEFLRKQGPPKDSDLGDPVWALEYVRLARSIKGPKELPEAAVFTGKSERFLGLAGRTPATGYGGYVFLKRALEVIYKTSMADKSIAIQGFGNVGQYFGLYAYRDGAKITKVTDVTTAEGGLKGLVLEAKDGINIEALFDHVKNGGSLDTYQQGGMTRTIMTLEEANSNFVASRVDVLAPAALQKVIRADNVEKVQADLVLELANGPLDPVAQATLARKGAVTLADFLSNSAGVFASFLERQQNLDGRTMTEAEVNSAIDTFMVRNFDATIKKMAETGSATVRTAGGLRAVDQWYGLLTGELNP